MIVLADNNNPDDASFQLEGSDVFIARDQELAYLDSLLKPAGRLSGQLVLLYGRRRVGKTVLARRWAETTKLPTLYWAAERETAGKWVDQKSVAACVSAGRRHLPGRPLRPGQLRETARPAAV